MNAYDINKGNNLMLCEQTNFLFIMNEVKAIYKYLMCNNNNNNNEKDCMHARYFLQQDSLKSPKFPIK